jgi:hypothetical protein
MEGIGSCGQPTRVVLKLGGWAWGYQLLTLKNKLLTKCHKGLRAWTDYLDKRPKRKKMDMRFENGPLRDRMGWYALD